MKLRRQQKQWEQLASEDPLWAILTDPSKKNRRWEPSEFFASGRAEIGHVMNLIESFGHPEFRHAALDFGCGVGRLTQALADHFDHVTGVDISAAMVELARQYNRAGDRCQYVVNTRNDLLQFPAGAFDLVYSHIVLQHLPPRHSRAYIREFVRILRPGGLALFQLPSAFRARIPFGGFLNHAYMVLNRRILGRTSTMEMYGVRPELVRLDVEKSGGRVVEIRKDESAGPEWESFLYVVSK
jgi:SAM-dependent methyltransferase